MIPTLRWLLRKPCDDASLSGHECVKRYGHRGWHESDKRLWSGAQQLWLTTEPKRPRWVHWPRETSPMSNGMRLCLWIVGWAYMLRVLTDVL